MATTATPSGDLSSQPQQQQKDDLLKQLQSETDTVPAATSAQGKASTTGQKSASETGGSSVYPSPSRDVQKTTTSTDSSTTAAPQQQQRTKGGAQGGMMLDPFQSSLVTAFSFIVLPVTMTIYRAYFANGGPTWFSWHPLMMLTSVVSVAGSVLAQRIEMRSPIRMTLLACASSWSVLLGFYVVWAVKEGFGKPHFISMHSHLGGMTLGAILTYGLAVPFVYNPLTGQVRNKQYQNYLVQFGKGATGMALFGMTIGMIEIERTWIGLLAWLASLALFVPFLIL